MTSDKFEVRARADMYQAGFEVAIFKGEGMVTAMTFQDMRDRPIFDPTLRGREGLEFLQAALNCAWECGLRPAGHQFTAETIAAKDRHLQDMRAIAFCMLYVEKPNG